MLNGTMAQGSGINALSKTADRVLLLDGLGVSVADSLGRLEMCVDDLRQINDALFGSEPEPDQIGSPRIADQSRLGGLQQQAESFSQLVDSLRGQIERLRAL